MSSNFFSKTGEVKKSARRVLAIMIAVAVSSGLLAGVTFLGTDSAQAVTGSDFQAGNIISDAVFYNGDAMVPSQIQEFLNNQVSSCASGYTCLKSYTENTPNRAADSYCTSSYTGVANQSAASIIYAVAQACSVNPQVLLVLLQKEQALVTSRSPSTAAYERATGYACPDTAPCAVDSLGFSNQVYKGARQYKVYRALPNSFGYVAGRTTSILFNPDRTCGSSPVYIQNQATAGLYDYTPYQPNASALANMYGSGDGCGAYGNRNFWRIFSDWFGSTQGGGTLARTGANAQIYLVTSDHKYPVNSGAVFTSLAALGPFQYTSQAYLDQFPTGIPATNLLRDATSGSIYLASNGAKNKFTSCDMVAAWGYGASCGPYIDVMQSQLLKFVTGPDVSSFALEGGTGIIYSVAGGVRRALHNFAQLVALANGGSTSYTGFDPATLAQLPVGPDYLDSGSVVKTASNPTLYLQTNAASSTLVPITTGNIYSEFGGGAITIVSDAGFAASNVVTTPLTLAITCGSQQYLAGGGVLWPLTNAPGLPTTSVDVANCAALPKSGTTVAGQLFIRTANGNVFAVSSGTKLFMTSMSQVNTLNGSNPLVLVPVSDATAASIPTRVETLAPASLVKTASNPTVYFIDGSSKKIPLGSFAVALAFGVQDYSVKSDGAVGAYATSGAPLSISVLCGANRYIAGGGSMTAIASADAGLPTNSLDAATCSALPKSSATVTGAVFLRAASGSIYVISGGTKHFVSTMDKVYSLNGANPLVFIPEDDGVLGTITSGAAA